MYLFKRVADLQQYLDSVRAGSRTFGFVPTMGALHDGHLSLVDQSRSDNQLTITSIFVNPTQFNEAEDLKKYPRTPVKDIELLHRVGNEVIFMPEVEEMYPEGMDTNVTIDLGELDKRMEGEFRPGHFAGVATVVNRLLEIVRPDRLYLGQKDYQQFLVVRKMVHQLGHAVEVISCPIIRESDGLAKSSRNVRLTPEDRLMAPAIHESLLQTREGVPEKEPAELKAAALSLLQEKGLRPEYFEIADANTLLPVTSWDESEQIIACVAAWAGSIRLIDNLFVKSE